MASQQQGPARPMFRFLSMARPAAPPPAAPAPTTEQPAQPQPLRPAFTFRPTTTQPPQPRPPTVAAAPPPPPPPPVSAPPPPQPSPTRVTLPPPPTAPRTPPPSQTTATTTRAATPKSSPLTSPAPAATATTARKATPKSSPKFVNQLEKIPFQSPKTKPISPLILPPAQIKSETPEPEFRISSETEKKTVLVQEKIEKPKLIHKSPNGESKTTQNGKSEAKKSSSSKSDEFGMSVITITGENRGAVMELSPSRKLHKFWGNPQTLQEKGNSECDDEKSETNMKPHLTKYMNSNVQGVNNSIFFNSSSTHHDPGVHFSLSRKINGNGGGSHFSLSRKINGNGGGSHFSSN